VLSQAASDAVIVTVRRPLTCADAVTWPVRLTARLVRIEGVGGSSPLSSTLSSTQSRRSEGRQAQPTGLTDHLSLGCHWDQAVTRDTARTQTILPTSDGTPPGAMSSPR